MNAIQNPDQDHLRLLSIFDYVLAGMLALFACFPLIYVAIGVAVVFASRQPSHGQPPPAFMGWLFVVFGMFASAMGWALAACVLAAGRSIAKRKRLLFCQIVAGIMCIFMPLGTALGIFTLIVLLRPSVKELFDTKR